MFYAPVQLGPRSAKTPEGFLVFYDAVIARCGLQTYGPGETPVEPGPKGYVRIERFPEDVFRPETMDSLQGAPLVNEHPKDDVDPKNFRELTCGFVLNPRRGKGAIEEDLCLADIKMMDAECIRAYERGKRQLSVGYDARYERLGPGHARQYDIIANHVALVDVGRCGARCSVLDHGHACFLDHDAPDEEVRTVDGVPVVARHGVWVPQTWPVRDREAARLGGPLDACSCGTCDGCRAERRRRRLKRRVGNVFLTVDGRTVRLMA